MLAHTASGLRRESRKVRSSEGQLLLQGDAASGACRDGDDLFGDRVVDVPGVPGLPAGPLLQQPGRRTGLLGFLGLGVTFLGIAFLKKFWT
ncbi:hypothetical protein [Actinomadura sp. B10D3]|uniref:hypothetical protein n=1 Tax=Actinomadura sp. B10D3 TaxID=3153557 RepID=UPI00325EA0DE